MKIALHLSLSVALVMIPFNTSAEEPLVANEVVPKQNSQTSLFPQVGERRALFEGGPELVNRGEMLEYRYPDGGSMKGHFGQDGRLLRTEEYDAGDRLVETREFGQEMLITRHGSPRTRERWTSKMSGATKETVSVVIEEKWDSKKGAFIETARREMPSVQACITHATAPASDLAKAVDTVICTGEGKNTGCNAARATSIDGYTDLSPPAVSSVGGICVDNGCIQRRVLSEGQEGCRWLDATHRQICASDTTNQSYVRYRDMNPEICADGYDPSASSSFLDPVTCFRESPAAGDLNNLLQETLYEGALCLANMAPGTAAARTRTVNRVNSNTLSGSSATALRAANQLPMRNSALMLMMYNQNNSFGDTMSANDQFVNEAVTAPDGSISLRNARRTQAQLSTQLGGAPNGPITIACGNGTLNASSRGVGRAMAAGPLPGSPGWPVMVLRNPINPEIFRPGSDFPGGVNNARQNYKGTLMHELMHMIGYPHDEASIPVHSACAAACFPTAGRTTGDRARRCTPELNTMSQNLNRQVCSGALGSRADSAAFSAQSDNFRRSNCACYETRNPHTSTALCSFL
ncbi:MAG: hypothetical protein IT285_14440 [Bdellovibrionales bacterium]|nr:hypothetical protein [Bdellovibrionales bacterium]